MSNKKILTLWTANVTSFILFVILCSTGLINWIVLPRGHEARGNALVSLRHCGSEVVGDPIVNLGLDPFRLIR